MLTHQIVNTEKELHSSALCLELRRWLSKATRKDARGPLARLSTRGKDQGGLLCLCSLSNYGF